MDKQSSMNQPESENMLFPPQINPQFGYNNFHVQNAKHPFNSIPYNQIKYQQSEFPYSYYSYESPKRFEYNQRQISPQYDLFEIQKKRKKQKYKRSTNNSHKKFISAIRRLFYAVISTKQKQEFQIQYSKYRSCRTFFFIILAYMKYRFSSKLLNSVRVSFINEMKIKINQYQEQINRTKNVNLKNFREQEIIDIKYSIRSCNQYFNGNTREAIESMYKKDKSTVIKRQHYESALRSVHTIQKELSSDPRSPLEQPFIQDYSVSSDKEKIEKKVIKREIRESQNAKFALEKDSQYQYDYPFLRIDPELKDKFLKPTRDTDQQESEIVPKVIQHEPKFLFPPLMEPIPYVRYDPFNPPFTYKCQKKFKYDVREDFFGFMNYGFPKFFQGSLV